MRRREKKMNEDFDIAQNRENDQTKTIEIIVYDGLPSSGSFKECHCAMGRRGDASISDQ